MTTTDTTPTTTGAAKAGKQPHEFVPYSRGNIGICARCNKGYGNALHARQPIQRDAQALFHALGGEQAEQEMEAQQALNRDADATLARLRAKYGDLDEPAKAS